MKLHSIRFFAAAAALAGGICLSSCHDDDVISNPEFIIEGAPTHFEFSAEAQGVTDEGYIKRDPDDEKDTNYARRIIVRSNTSWKIRVADDTDWLLVFPPEGRGDGYVSIGVKENERFDPRSSSFTINIDGEETPMEFAVHQQGAPAKLSIPNRYILTAQGGKTFIPIISNIGWTAEKVDEEGSEWLSLAGFDEEGVTVDAATREEDSPRTASIAVHCPQAPELDGIITLMQFGPSVILYEDFETFYSPLSPDAYYGTSGLSNMPAWSDKEFALGWSSWMSPNSGKTNPAVYGVTIQGNSSVKLGRTDENGTIASPRLYAIGPDKTMDVKVSFQACPYVAAGSAKKSSAYDSNRLYVFVYGGGTIEDPNSSVEIGAIRYVYNGNWETPFKAEDYPEAQTPEEARIMWLTPDAKPGMTGVHQAKLFILDNYATSKYTKIKFHDDPLKDGSGDFEFIIRGATENTQIVFQGGEWADTWAGTENSTKDIIDLTGATFNVPLALKCNRVYIDDVIVRNLNTNQ